MILNATNICKTFKNGQKELPVLVDLNLTLDAGEIVTIMGESGAGKSTLLNILGTLDKADAGRITYNGIDIAAMNDDQLAQLRNAHIGFVFQFHHLLPEFTALENVLIPAMIKGEEKTRLARALELFDYIGLNNRQSHFPSQLSGGERLRVAVLRSLINEPQLVLADEPTGNLDIGNANRLLDLFIRIRNDFQQTLLISTHNPKVAAIGDRQLLLQDGTLKVTDSISLIPTLVYKNTS